MVRSKISCLHHQTIRAMSVHNAGEFSGFTTKDIAAVQNTWAGMIDSVNEYGVRMLILYIGTQCLYTYTILKCNCAYICAAFYYAEKGYADKARLWS